MCVRMRPCNILIRVDSSHGEVALSASLLSDSSTTRHRLIQSHPGPVPPNLLLPPLLLSSSLPSVCCSVQTPGLPKAREGGGSGGGGGRRRVEGVGGTQLLSTRAHSVQLLLLHQLGRIHKVAAVKKDDAGRDHTGCTPEQHVRQRLRPCVTCQSSVIMQSLNRPDVKGLSGF